MSNKIKPGDIVEITAIHSKSIWTGHDKIKGIPREVVRIGTATKLPEPWKFLETKLVPQDRASCFSEVKIRRIKK